MVSASRKRREPVELFRSVNVDWLRLKWYFLAFSMIFSVAGLISMGIHWKQIGSPVPLGVDFKGGTQVQVQVPADAGYQPDSPGHCGRRHQGREHSEHSDRRSMNPAATKCSSACRSSTIEAALDPGRQQIVDALQAHYDNPFDSAQCGRGRPHGGPSA